MASRLWPARAESCAENQRDHVVVAANAFRNPVGFQELVVGAPAGALDGRLARGESLVDGRQVGPGPIGEASVNPSKRVARDIAAQVQEQRQPAPVLRRLIPFQARRPAHEARFALARPAGEVAPLVCDDERAFDRHEIGLTSTSSPYGLIIPSTVAQRKYSESNERFG